MVTGKDIAEEAMVNESVVTYFAGINGISLPCEIEDAEKLYDIVSKASLGDMLRATLSETPRTVVVLNRLTGKIDRIDAPSVGEVTINQVRSLDCFSGSFDDLDFCPLNKGIKFYVVEQMDREGNVSYKLVMADEVTEHVA